jgi:hypothetical protein
MRFTPDIRAFFRKLWKEGKKVKEIADFFGTTRKTVYRWINRAKHVGREHYTDKPRKPKQGKVTVNVEVSILGLRSLGWGTARIQQGLYKLPSYLLDSLPFDCPQGVRLSRQAINDVLTRHRANGYQRTQKSWKFFRASQPDELWQLDLKGPYAVHGKKYWFIVCIDDYSRFLLLSEQLDHCPTAREITDLLDRLGSRPKSILTDNGVQFKEQWVSWCETNSIKPLFAHPYYPQDKGKVERAIRNLSEEFVKLLRKFPGWLDGKIHDYRSWFNNDRFHRGVKGFPAELYNVSLES